MVTVAVDVLRVLLPIRVVLVVEPLVVIWLFVSVVKLNVTLVIVGLLALVTDPLVVLPLVVVPERVLVVEEFVVVAV
jgi:hypothetical protein